VVRWLTPVPRVHLVPATRGVGACEADGQLICSSGSLVDTCTAGTPGSGDATCDGFDNDCNGSVDDGYVPTPTSCGVGACGATGATSCVGGAVQDSCAPGTPADDETCDGEDNDCDGETDEGFDADADDFTTCGGDCDDADPTEHPGQTWYKDADGDDYSDGTTDTTSCTRPDGYYTASELTEISGDCDDDEAAVNPGATEVCNGIDDDCNDGIDEGYDIDNDGFANCYDNCPSVANADQVDADLDGAGAACDPDDGDPYVCGDIDEDTCDDCSSGDNDPANDGPDADFDGLCDNGDDCPYDPENDVDEDGVCGNEDNCPSIYNPDQVDEDGDNAGAACDSDDGDPDVCGDTDEDTCDDCSSGSNDPANDGLDTDSDGLCDAGDQCDNDPENDVDEDGICGDVDNCPYDHNPEQVDADADGAGAACDSNDGDPVVCCDIDEDTCDDCSSGDNDPANDGPDTDLDGICDNGDNCPDDSNAEQLDTDDDGFGDACDFCPNDADNDVDGDEVCGDEDNCPSTYNPGQTDSDDDGIGDGCDPSDPPVPPTPETPEDGDSFDVGDPIILDGSPFNDPNGSVHYYTYWQIRRADKPYNPDDEDLYVAEIMIDGVDLTQYEIPAEVLEKLEPGIKYAWRIGYMDEYNYNFGDPSWSTWSSFKIGTSVADGLPPIPPGTDLADYRMVSFTQWPDDPAATSGQGILDPGKGWF